MSLSFYKVIKYITDESRYDINTIVMKNDV